MSELTLEVNGQEDMERKLPKINTRAVLAAGAGEYKSLWQQHFKALDARGNRNGFPARHFWIDEGFKKTEIAELTAELARVTCDSRAVAYQAHGGTIRPVSGKAIAQPVSATAYAAGWPSNSGLPLEFVFVRSRKYPNLVGKLIEAQATKIGYGKKGVINKGQNTATAGKTHYLLWSYITKTQGMGDAVFPSASADAVSAKMSEALQRQMQPQGK